MNWAFFAIFAVVGLLIGYLFLQPVPKNQVLYCRERDYRGSEYNIDKEDALTLITKTSPPLRFFKYGKSFVFDIKTRMRRPKKVARFFAKEGTAYTWHMEGFKKIPTEWETKTISVKDPKGKMKEHEIRVPTKFEEQKISLDTKTQEDQIKATIGHEAYNMFPEWYKTAFRNNLTNVTVGLEPGLTPKDMPIIDEETLSTKADEQMASLLARGFEAVGKVPFINIILAIGSGIAIGFALVGFGLIPIGGA